MSLNKEIIIQIVTTFVVIFMFYKIVAPVIFEFFKNKIPGAYNPDNDIDSMIRRQKERLRAQYGLNPPPVTSTQQKVSESSLETNPEDGLKNPPTEEVKTLFKESKWGGSPFTKKIQDEITKNYGYTLAESKINAFILLSEKKKYLNYLSIENQKSMDALSNYLSILMLFLISIEEIRNKEINFIEKMAKKCKISPQQMLLALQIKVLLALKNKKEVKEEKIFSPSPILLSFSEDSIEAAVDSLLKKEANFWARGHSIFFEELALHISYADLLVPLPVLKNKSDVETAKLILKVDDDVELEEIKKIYKKNALTFHPDKIGQLKLPTSLEKHALRKFNMIQDAYEILVNERKR